MVNIIFYCIFQYAKLPIIFQLFNISELKNHPKKSIESLYIKKVKKQVQMRFILTNLFTTLWCQRKHNPRRLLLVRLALLGRGHGRWLCLVRGHGQWLGIKEVIG